MLTLPPEFHSDVVLRLQRLEGQRLLVALAGPPGSGKSTLAQKLADALNHDDAESTAIVPMDGFHYDDAVLDARGLGPRKGSPPTFDVSGLKILLTRMRANAEAEVAVPLFDRKLELSRAGARIIPSSVRIIIVEGNYLLLNSEPWLQLTNLFNFTIMVSEDRTTLEKRLINRWLSFGFDVAAARKKVFDNDLPNVELVVTQSRKADVIIRSKPGQA